MNSVNYDREMQNIIAKQTGIKKLLLHSCCAPCSSYCITELSKYFDVTVFYYNPNIDRESEYALRAAEQKRFIAEYPAPRPVAFVEQGYFSEDFLPVAAGRENLPERGERCQLCYRLRLEKAALYAKNNGFDYFATTLTLSPLKPAEIINQIGVSLEKQYGIYYLVSDFKKREGYKQSIRLSAEYGLYRQNYCGCKYSKGNVTETR